MKKLLLAFAFLFVSFTTFSQVLVSSVAIDTITKFQLAVFISGAQYDVVTYKLTYNTTDIDGSATIASMALAVPLDATCDTFSMVSYNHGTVLMREDVPSRNNFESIIGKGFASWGYVAVMADYLGLGDNAGLHPWLHQESQATATIDAMRAAREFIGDSLSDSIVLNNEVLLTGYSQGGHASMGTAKYIQENNLLGEFNVIAAAPASGPYNLAGSQARIFIDDEPYSNPGYVVYLIMGMNRVYGNIYQDISDILKSPYDTIIPPLFDGTYDMTTVNAALPSKISEYLVDTVLQNFVSDSIGQTHPIWQALNKNTNYNWNPQMPMRLYYCTADEQVEFENSIDAAAAMQAYGASVKAQNMGNLNHGDCVSPALTATAAFFDSASTSCGREAIPVSILERNYLGSINVYPNPAKDYINIDGLSEGNQLRLFNSAGQRLKSQTARTEKVKMYLSNLPKGLYFLYISNQENTSTRAVLIK